MKNNNVNQQLSYTEEKVIINNPPEKGEELQVFLRPGDKIILNNTLFNKEQIDYQLVNSDLILKIKDYGNISFVSSGLMSFKGNSPSITFSNGESNSLDTILRKLPSVKIDNSTASLTEETYDKYIPTSKEDNPEQKNEKKNTPINKEHDEEKEHDEIAPVAQQIVEQPVVVATNIEEELAPPEIKRPKPLDPDLINPEAPVIENPSSKKNDLKEENPIEEPIEESMEEPIEEPKKTVLFGIHNIDFKHEEASYTASEDTLSFIGAAGHEYPNDFKLGLNGKLVSSEKSKSELMKQIEGFTVNNKDVLNKQGDSIIDNFANATIHTANEQYNNETHASRVMELQYINPEGYTPTSIIISGIPEGVEVIGGTKLPNGDYILTKGSTFEEGFLETKNLEILFKYDRTLNNIKFNLKIDLEIQNENGDILSTDTNMNVSIKKVETEDNIKFDSNGDENGTVWATDDIDVNIISSDANTHVIGNYTDNIIITKNGNDLIQAGNGNDIINPGTGQNDIDGGEGIDTLDYSKTIKEGNKDEGTTNYDQGVTVNFVKSFPEDKIANDNNIINIEEVIATNKDDTFKVDSGSYRIEGKEGSDTIDFSKLNEAVSLQLNNEEESIANKGSNGKDTLTNIENIIGTDFDDNFTGDDSDNSINAAAGADTIYASEGRDIIDGGIGSDTIDFSELNAGVELTLNGTRYVTADKGINGKDILTNIENITGTDFVDNFTGDDLDNIINTGAGNDTIYASKGSDTIDGGIGADTINFSELNEAVSLHLNNTQESIANKGNNGKDTLTNIENITGTDFDDDFEGDDSKNTIYASTGNDRIYATGGSDIIHGGGGVDTIDFSKLGTGVTLTLKNSGYATVSGGNNSRIADIENIIGTDNNDIFVGNNYNNSINSGDGNDRVYASKGNDTIDGEGGLDTIDFSKLNAGVKLALNGAGNTTAEKGNNGNDTLSNIENIIGTNRNDDFTGDDLDNTIYAGAGNDTIYASKGSDIINGGAGVDTLQDNTIRSSLVTLNTTNSTLETGDSKQTFNAIESVITSGQDDTFIVNNINSIKTLNAGEGTDTLITEINMDLSTLTLLNFEKIEAKGDLTLSNNQISGESLEINTADSLFIKMDNTDAMDFSKISFTGSGTKILLAQKSINLTQKDLSFFDELQTTTNGQLIMTESQVKSETITGVGSIKIEIDSNSSTDFTSFLPNTLKEVLLNITDDTIFTGIIDSQTKINVESAATLTINAQKASGHSLLGNGELIITDIQNNLDSDFSKLTTSLTVNIQWDGNDTYLGNLTNVDKFTVSSGSQLSIQASAINEPTVIINEGIIIVTNFGTNSSVDLSKISGGVVTNIIDEDTNFSGNLGDSKTEVTAGSTFTTNAQIADEKVIEGNGSTVINNLQEGSNTADFSNITTNTTIKWSGEGSTFKGDLGNADLMIESGTMSILDSALDITNVTGAGNLTVIVNDTSMDMSNVNISGKLIVEGTDNSDIFSLKGGVDEVNLEWGDDILTLDYSNIDAIKQMSGGAGTDTIKFTGTLDLTSIDKTFSAAFEDIEVLDISDLNITGDDSKELIFTKDTVNSLSSNGELTLKLTQDQLENIGFTTQDGLWHDAVTDAMTYTLDTGVILTVEQVI